MFLISLVVSTLTFYGSHGLRLAPPSNGDKTPEKDLLLPRPSKLEPSKSDLPEFHKVGKLNSNVLDLPESWRGKRLVFIGDSVDLYTLDHMAQLHQADSQYISGYNGLLNLNALSRGKEYHYRNHDLIVNFVFHPGVSSIPPQPNWHAYQYQSGAVRWRHGIIPRYADGREAISSIEVANHALEHFAVADARPMIVMVQSSLWDSVLAKEAKANAYEDAARPEEWVKMGWFAKASQLIESIEQNKRVEQVYWRTTSNCPNAQSENVNPELEPDNIWIDSVTEMQAAEIRNAVLKRVSPWDKVELIDWRQNYTTQVCDGIHYPPEGYENLFSHFKSVAASKNGKQFVASKK